MTRAKKSYLGWRFEHGSATRVMATAIAELRANPRSALFPQHQGVERDLAGAVLKMSAAQAKDELMAAARFTGYLVSYRRGRVVLRNAAGLTAIFGTVNAAIAWMLGGAR